MQKVSLVFAILAIGFSSFLGATETTKQTSSKSTHRSNLGASFVCSRAWLNTLNKKCDGSDNGTCYSMLNEGRKALVSQRKIIIQVLNNPEEFSQVEKAWDRYRNAECAALVPQCPEGQSGSCNDPSAMCEVHLGCEHVIHLKKVECETGGYNRSLSAPAKPNSCNE